MRQSLLHEWKKKKNFGDSGLLFSNYFFWPTIVCTGVTKGSVRVLWPYVAWGMDVIARYKAIHSALLVTFVGKVQFRDMCC